MFDIPQQAGHQKVDDSFQKSIKEGHLKIGLAWSQDLGM